MTRLNIYYWDYFILIEGALNKVPPHSHNAVQIFINKKDSQEIIVENIKLTSPFIFVDKNIEHEIFSSGKHQYSLLIDGDSKLSKHLAHSLKQHKSHLTDEQIIKLFSYQTPHELKKKLDLFSYNNCIECTGIDSRIILAKKLIDQNDEKKLSLKELSEKVYLSESRLAHLFKEQIGVPLRKYLLWKRLNSALKIILDGKNLTYAAYQSGFSDSAHLSRTFKSCYGMNLSKIFKNSKFIQFHNLN